MWTYENSKWLHILHSKKFLRGPFDAHPHTSEFSSAASSRVRQKGRTHRFEGLSTQEVPGDAHGILQANHLMRPVHWHEDGITSGIERGIYQKKKKKTLIGSWAGV